MSRLTTIKLLLPSEIHSDDQFFDWLNMVLLCSHIDWTFCGHYNYEKHLMITKNVEFSQIADAENFYQLTIREDVDQPMFKPQE